MSKVYLGDTASRNLIMIDPYVWRNLKQYVGELERLAKDAEAKEPVT